jgi:tRNA-2-methylthio-N6-dimethylallyladenosine synthase
MAERLKARLLDQQKLADLVVGPDAYRDLPRIIAAVQVSCSDSLWRRW